MSNLTLNVIKSIKNNDYTLFIRLEQNLGLKTNV